MTSVPNALPSALRIQRSDDGRVVAGVAAGIARSFGADPVLVRLVFAVLALAGGSGILLYLAAWLLLPPPGAASPRNRTAKIGAAALFVITGLVALRGLGFEDSVIPAALIALGVVLVSRRASRARAIGGIVLVVAGTTAYVNAASPFGGGEGFVAPGAVAIALIAIVAPWLWRLGRERDAERLARIRSEERAEMAARVHDSVLQTIALIQRHADDPKRVAILARRQERELRGWLYGQRERGATVTSAIEDAANDVEELHGVRVEVVGAGDAALDERLDALVLATREAMTNAAKFSGVDSVSVYVEARDDAVSVFVRDRGVGFDRDAVPEDRHGIRESIVQRLARHSGTATITTAPGEGTDVELRMPRS